MASGPITSQQIEGRKVKAVTDSSWALITTDGNCSHENWKSTASWQESYDKPRWCVKKQSYQFASKGPYSQHVIPFVTYGYDSWTIKKAEH